MCYGTASNGSTAEFFFRVFPPFFNKAAAKKHGFDFDKIRCMHVFMLSMHRRVSSSLQKTSINCKSLVGKSRCKENIALRLNDYHKAACMHFTCVSLLRACFLIECKKSETLILGSNNCIKKAIARILKNLIRPFFVQSSLLQNHPALRTRTSALHEFFLGATF